MWILSKMTNDESWTGQFLAARVWGLFFGNSMVTGDCVIGHFPRPPFEEAQDAKIVSHRLTRIFLNSLVGQGIVP